MRKRLLMGAVGGLSLSWGAATASALVVADYQADFTYPVPSNGWSYHWNANGAIGNPANYVSLVPDAAGRYETVDQTPDAFPDPTPGSSLSITNTTLIPGQGSAQNDFERSVIVAYTVSAEDIAAAGGNQLRLEEWSFAVGASTNINADGVTARIYKNDNAMPFVEADLPPGIVFDHNIPDPNGGAIPLGPFNAGDVLYIAVGSDGIASELTGGNDTDDTLVMNLKIALVPEPATASIIGAAALALLMRRRPH
jgi:hypothetical protein